MIVRWWLRTILAAYLFVGGVLLGGCVHVGYEPALEMPARPSIHFKLCGELVCLSQEDADKLAKYLDKMNAFEAARQRALEEH